MSPITRKYSKDSDLTDDQSLNSSCDAPDISNFLGNYSTDLDPYFDLSLDNHGFDTAIGTEVPPIYKTLLKMEEECTGFEFTLLYEAMWNTTFEYAPSKNESFNYFADSEQMIHFNKLYTDKSHRGRSAFLKSLGYKKKVTTFELCIPA